MQSPNHRLGKLDILLQHAKHKQAIPACNWPIRSQREARHTISACSSLDKLTQHAVSQLKSREARHAIPTCSGSQSQHRKARHDPSIHSASTLSRHTLHKSTCIKEAKKAQNSRQTDTATCCTLEEQSKRSSRASSYNILGD